jgi:hypothetical protein
MARELPSVTKEKSRLTELAATTQENRELIERYLSRHTTAREIAERLVDKLVSESSSGATPIAELDELVDRSSRPRRRSRRRLALLCCHVTEGLKRLDQFRVGCEKKITLVTAGHT